MRSSTTPMPDFFGLTDSTLSALAIRGSQQLEQAAPFQVRLEGPATLQVLFNGHRPIRIADVNRHRSGGGIPAQSPEWKCNRTLERPCAHGCGCPWQVKDRILGGLGVAHAQRNYFTPHHAALALSMADQVAITMVNAELYEHAGHWPRCRNDNAWRRTCTMPSTRASSPPA